MNRIEEKLAQLKEQNKKAFITYMTAGMPDFDNCLLYTSPSPRD